jgi:peroxiredoxin Q/BCP
MMDSTSSSLICGQLAPEVTAVDDQGQPATLASFQGKHVVLYFYPKDDTPGCTQEANDFAALVEEFNQYNAIILGISRDSTTSHQKFKKKYCLPFTLLSDTTGETCQRYGVWVEKSMYGKKYMGIARATIWIDTTGNVRKIWPKVSVPGHAQEVLASIKSAVN